MVVVPAADTMESGLRIYRFLCGSHDTVVEPLATRLGRVFGWNVSVHVPRFDPEAAFDASRGQYHATMLLAGLLAEPAPAGTRVLGVTSVDLFIPILTYVFGEAQLLGRAALISLYRLRSEIYGMPRDEGQLLSRCEKEAVHELGHTYGLVHCSVPKCVMQSSTYMEEIDLKSAQFCSPCAARLRS